MDFYRTNFHSVSCVMEFQCTGGPTGNFPPNEGGCLMDFYRTNLHSVTCKLEFQCGDRPTGNRLPSVREVVRWPFIAQTFRVCSVGWSSSGEAVLLETILPVYLVAW